MVTFVSQDASYKKRFPEQFEVLRTRHINHFTIKITSDIRRVQREPNNNYVNMNGTTVNE